jgi:hypothetical protein
MPPELRTRLEDAAKLDGRSLHAEIIQRLEQSFNLSPVVVSGFDEMIGRLSERNRPYFFAMYEALLNVQEDVEPIQTNDQ